MKKLFLLIIAAATLLSFRTVPESVQLTVKNPSKISRLEEMVEVPMAGLREKLSLEDKENIIVCNESGEQIPYQITYDDKLIFQTSLEKKSKAHFMIRKGKPEHFEKIACGRCFPEQLDDMAWENDKISCRAYGPGTQKRKQRGFGYDIFTKRGTTRPVLEILYKAKPGQDRTYHLDHGYGMDCYYVGATLGAGTAALLENDKIIFPWCFETYEILDNGPLRFTVKLVYTPLQYKNIEVIETRIISLDAGSHLNKVNVTYAGINQKVPVVSGIVLHDDGARYADKKKGIIAYQDPTSGKNNGEVYLGHVYDHHLTEAGPVYFSKEERKKHDNVPGHMLAQDVYDPENGLTYWWGFGWNRSDVPSFESWKSELEDFSIRVRHPLVVIYR